MDGAQTVVLKYLPMSIDILKKESESKCLEFWENKNKIPH